MFCIPFHTRELLPYKDNATRRKHYSDNRGVMCTRRRRIQRGCNLKIKFGITEKDYDAMHERQSGLCAICGKPETDRDQWSGNTRRLAVDHCHITKRVRGLLCGQCNKGLGHFKDRVDLLESAAEYLKKSEESSSHTPR